MLCVRTYLAKSFALPGPFVAAECHERLDYRGLARIPLDLEDPSSFGAA
jgi:hypothetical protein